MFCFLFGTADSHWADSLERVNYCSFFLNLSMLLQKLFLSCATEIAHQQTFFHHFANQLLLWDPVLLFTILNNSLSLYILNSAALKMATAQSADFHSPCHELLINFLPDLWRGCLAALFFRIQGWLQKLTLPLSLDPLFLAKTVLIVLPNCPHFLFSL